MSQTIATETTPATESTPATETTRATETTPANLELPPAQIQLLPPRYYARQQSRRVLCLWAFVALTLMSVLGAVLVPVWVRGQRIRLSNSRLIDEAKPLIKLQRDNEMSQIEHARLAQWADWVESAKPDDSLLQVVAAITQATDAAESGIQVEMLAVQLPLEYDKKYQKPPPWAAPRLAVTATVADRKNVPRWIERINQSARIDDAAAKLTSGSPQGGSVQVTGKPLATRMLP